MLPVKLLRKDYIVPVAEFVPELPQHPKARIDANGVNGPNPAGQLSGTDIRPRTVASLAIHLRIPEQYRLFIRDDEYPGDWSRLTLWASGIGHRPRRVNYLKNATVGRGQVHPV